MYYRTYREKRNKIIKFFPGAIHGVAFLQVPADSYSDVTFSCKHKDVVTKVVATLLTMAESVPSVSAASSNSFLAVSTPLESAASSSNVQVVSSRSEMLSKLCFTKLLAVPSQSHITCMSCHFDRRRRNNRLHRTFSKKRVILSCTCNSV